MTKAELIEKIEKDLKAKRMLYSGHETYEMKLMQEALKHLGEEDPKK